MTKTQQRTTLSSRRAWLNDETRVSHTKRDNVRSNDYTERVLRGMRDGVMVVDDAGRVLDANPACERMLCASLAELTGRAVADWIPGDWRMSTLETSLADRGALQTREVTCVRADGSTFPAEISLECGAAGDPLLLLIHDCSVVRRLEREILENSGAIRRKLGQDLHDDLGQVLTGVAFLACALARDAPDHLRERLERLMSLANSSIARSHAIAEGLAPALPKGGAVVEQFRELARITQENYGVCCVLETRGDFSELDPDAGIQVFLIGQEAVMNAVRHAHCQRIEISLMRDGPRHSLIVADDGRGLPGVLRPESLGIRSMSYRARVIDGLLELRAREGRGGLEVRCQWPRAS